MLFTYLNKGKYISLAKLSKSKFKRCPPSRFIDLLEWFGSLNDLTNTSENGCAVTKYIGATS